MARIANRDARKYVQNQQPFEGSNLYSGIRTHLYIVYSYGPHFPLWVYVHPHKMWVGNSDTYSQSTSRHKRQTDPLAEKVVWLNTGGLRDLIGKGPDALAELIVKANLPPTAYANWGQYL